MIPRFRMILFALVVGLYGAEVSGQEVNQPRRSPVAEESKRAGNGSPLRSPDVVYVPTPTDVVEAMLKVAKVRNGDVVYDLGSGDGRIPIMAVEKYHAARALGVDINPERVREAQTNAKKAGVADRVRFLNQDLFETKISDATVVTLYLLSSLNLKLLPKLLEELTPGTRVVSHAFDMGTWKPQQTLTIDARQVYFWIIPQKGTPEYNAALTAAGKTTSFCADLNRCRAVVLATLAAASYSTRR